MIPNYYSKKDENGNYCIYKNCGELLCIYLDGYGKKYFERKIEDLAKRNIHVTNMD